MKDTIIIFILLVLIFLLFPIITFGAEVKVTYKLTMPSKSHKLSSVYPDKTQPAHGNPATEPKASGTHTGGGITKFSNSVTPSGAIEDKIRARFGEYANTAIAVFRAESGLRCNAVNQWNSNGTQDYGIAQINSIHLAKFHGANPLDCDANLDVAYQIFTSWGHTFKAWSAYNNGSYEKFL